MATIVCSCGERLPLEWERRQWWEDRAAALDACVVTTDGDHWWFEGTWSPATHPHTGWLATNISEVRAGLTHGQAKKLRRHLRETYPVPLLHGVPLPAALELPGTKVYPRLNNRGMGPAVDWYVSTSTTYDDVDESGTSKPARLDRGFTFRAHPDETDLGPALAQLAAALGNDGLRLLTDLTKTHCLRDALAAVNDALATPKDPA